MEMYLTKLVNIAGSSSNIEDFFKNCGGNIETGRRYGIQWYSQENEQYWHCLVCGLADKKRENGNLLYIRDGNRALYVQSDEPIKENVAKMYGYRCVDEPTNVQSTLETIHTGDAVTLLGRYAPTYHDENGKKKSIRDKEDQLRWMVRKAAENGFAITDIRSLQEDFVRFHKNNKAEKGFFNVCMYKMEAQVTDAELFRNAIHKGIGPKKAYGCGMTLVHKKEA